MLDFLRVLLADDRLLGMDVFWVVGLLVDGSPAAHRLQGLREVHKSIKLTTVF
jgi:hypothetical protein